MLTGAVSSRSITVGSDGCSASSRAADNEAAAFWMGTKLSLAGDCNSVSRAASLSSKSSSDASVGPNSATLLPQAFPGEIVRQASWRVVRQAACGAGRKPDRPEIALVSVPGGCPTD